MRIFLSIIFLIRLSSAQISSIGIFKINQTKINVLDSIAKVSDIPITDNDELIRTDKMTDSKSLTIIYSLHKNSDKLVGAQNTFLQEDVKVYYMNYYSVSDLNLTNVFLTFWGGVLINFECDGSMELSNALSLKYGKAKITVLDKKKIYCQNGFGAKTEHDEASYVYNWNPELNQINATQLLSISYDDDCKERLVDLFYLADSKKMEQIGNNESKIEKQFELRKQQEEKSKLKDL